MSKKLLTNRQSSLQIADYNRTESCYNQQELRDSLSRSHRPIAPAVDKGTQTVKFDEYNGGMLETSGRSMQQSFHKDGFSQQSASANSIKNQNPGLMRQLGSGLIQETEKLGESLDNKICAFVKLMLNLENVRNITGQDPTIYNIID